METFDRLAGSLDYPMLIATTASGQERAGCLVGFATQTSIDPPRFLACLSRRNHTYRVACAASDLAVHVVPAGAIELAQLFGGGTGEEIDKFERCSWSEGPRGLPILADCPNWFAGSILERAGLGDHVGFLLDPFAARRDDEVAWLGFQEAKQIDPGHDA